MNISMSSRMPLLLSSKTLLRVRSLPSQHYKVIEWARSCSHEARPSEAGKASGLEQAIQSEYGQPNDRRWSLKQKIVQGSDRGRHQRLRSSNRGFSSSAMWNHNAITRPAAGTGITVHFQDSKGNLIKSVEVNEGDNILDIAHEYDVDLEGACEGSVACSTCHVILPAECYDLLPEPEDEENDMLDMAFGLTDTSRLGCQVKITKELDGIVVKLPAATRNMYVGGDKPTKH